MIKEKLRFRDLWNRWYLWVFMLVLVLFDPLSSYTRDEEMQSLTQLFQETGDEAGLYCINEFPGLWYSNTSNIEYLLIAFVILMIVYAIINIFRKTK